MVGEGGYATKPLRGKTIGVIKEPNKLPKITKTPEPEEPFSERPEYCASIGQSFGNIFEDKFAPVKTDVYTTTGSVSLLRLFGSMNRREVLRVRATREAERVAQEECMFAVIEDEKYPRQCPNETWCTPVSLQLMYCAVDVEPMSIWRYSNTWKEENVERDWQATCNYCGLDCRFRKQ